MNLDDFVDSEPVIHSFAQTLSRSMSDTIVGIVGPATLAAERSELGRSPSLR